jgi:hypothetical protein
LQQLISEQQVYSNYERGLDVPPTMWGNVRSQIAAAPPVGFWERFRSGFNSLFSFTPINAVTTVALVFLAVAITVGVMRYFNRNSQQQTAVNNSEVKPAAKVTPVAVESPAKTAVNQPHTTKEVQDTPRAQTGRTKTQTRRESTSQTTTAAQLVREAEQKYLSAIALLNRDMRRHPSRIDADTKARFEGALADIDRTIASTRAAVRRDPNDPVAVQYMLSAYRKKVDVLREMTGY